jgi:hypothetical protein
MKQLLLLTIFGGLLFVAATTNSIAYPPTSTLLDDPSELGSSGDPKWDTDKQNRWAAFQAAVASTPMIIDMHQRAVEIIAMSHHITPAELQNYLDTIEQHRTGNPKATSCRKAQQPGHYTSAGCSRTQLLLEFFQENEEQAIKHLGATKH